MPDNIDKNILKTLISNKTKAVAFSKEFDNSLFSLEYKDYAKLIIDYIRSYNTLPSKRTFIDKYAINQESLKNLSNFWDSIESHQYNDTDYEYDLKEIKERFKRNTIKKISNSLLDKMQVGIEPNIIIKDINLNLQKLSVLDSGRSYIQESAGSYVDKFINNYEASKNMVVESKEVKTNYSTIDEVTGGFSPSELIVIAGETNSGKSMFLSNMSIQMWLQGNDIYSDVIMPGYNVLYFSLEMPYEDCFRRYIARLADINERDIKKATLDSDSTDRMMKALDFIKRYEKAGYFFEIVDVPRDVTIEEIELRYNDALLKFKPDIVVVDYMGLMHDRVHAKDQDWLKLGAIAASLHEFSRSHDIIVLTALQLTDIKRGNKGKDMSDEQKVGTHRIGRSSLIMHHVNVGIQIETRANERFLPDMKYHVIKNRKGPLASGTLIKNFENSALFDTPHVDSTVQSPQSSSIPELIKRVRET